MQTHVPPEHICPAAHGAWPPHSQVPESEHVSDVMPQSTHATPPLPHAPGVGVTHTPAWQQPFGHDVASQLQTPPEQTWPAGHAGPLPQPQVPPSHESAVLPQLWHAPPAVPQADAVGGVVQVEPEQQPYGQLVPSHPLHTPAEQVSLPGQLVHMAPPEPHALGSLPGSHVVPEQHPVGQDVASQTHVAPTHS